MTSLESHMVSNCFTAYSDWKEGYSKYPWYIGPFKENSSVTGGFPSQRTSNVEPVSIHDNVIKWDIFRVTGPLWGESTGHRWIPLTKASDSERWSNVFFDLHLNKPLSKHRRFETPSRSLRHHCNVSWHHILHPFSNLSVELWLRCLCPS